MPDDDLVYGLYEAFGAACNVNLEEGTIRIHHDLFITRDDDEARAVARRKSGGLPVEVRRVMDVRPTP